MSENQTPEPDLDRPAASLLRDFLIGGVNYPWTLGASVALGILLLATLLVFGTQPPLYFSDHVLGCLIIMIAVTAMAEVARPVRFLNMPLGLALAASPFVFEGGTQIGTTAAVIIGVALVVLSLPRGTQSEENYGGWDRAIV